MVNEISRKAVRGVNVIKTNEMKKLSKKECVFAVVKGEWYDMGGGWEKYLTRCEVAAAREPL